MNEQNTDAHKRATAVAEEGELPEDNPFADVVRELHDDGHSWREIHDMMEAAYGPVDAAAYEEGFRIVPEWRVAALEWDPDTPSEQRYEYYERVAESAEEAEEMVERHTGCPVASDKTERVGTCKVS